MVPIKPYTAIITAVQASQDSDGVLGNPSPINTSTTVQCYFERQTPDEVYATYGVELKNPAVIQCEISDSSSFTPDAEVLVRGAIYKVVGNPELHDAGNDADHADIVLEFKNYPLPRS